MKAAIACRPVPPPSDDTAVLSLELLEGARQRLELARQSILQGQNPRPRLRSAMVRIARLPATLAPPADSAIAASLTDLSDYMCRRLRTVRNEDGVGTLDSVCDLLREIRCGWVTPPAAPSTLRADSRRTAGM
jgi:flagellar protein FliS